MSELDNPEVKCPQVLSEDPNPAGVAFKTEDKILMSAVASLEVPSSKKDSKPSQLKHSASCNPAAPEATSPSPYPDWDKGLPSNALELIAKGRNDLKAMLEVSKSWQQAFEGSVTSLKIGARAGLGLRMGGSPFAERFLGLVNLFLGESEIDEAEMKKLASMKRLQSLFLGGDDTFCGWDGEDEDWLFWESRAHRHELQQRLLGSWLSHLFSLHSLTLLSLRGCPGIDDSGLEGLRGLSINCLDLAWCHNLKGAGLEYLRGLPLTSLDLTYCCQLVEIPELKPMPLANLNLGHCPNIGTLQGLQGLPLVRLSLGNCIYKCGCLSSLEGLQGMPWSHLDLSYSERLVDQSLEPLLGLPLTFLNLEGCKGLVGEGLEFLRGMPLADLKLGNCVELEDSGILCLGELPITSLEIFGCRKLTGQGLRPLSGMPLQKLNLAGCSNLGSESFKYLRDMSLADLEMWNVGLLDDAGLGYLSGLTHLTRLVLGASCNFNYHCNVTDTGLMSLQGMPLVFLGLIGFRKVTDVGLELFLRGMPLLTGIDLRTCHLLTPACLLGVFQSLLPRLSHVRLPGSWPTWANVQYFLKEKGAECFYYSS